ERAHGRALGSWLEFQPLVSGDDHGARNRRQIARLAALLVVLNELVNLAADDLALVGAIAGRDAAFEQVPVDLWSGTLPSTAHGRMDLVRVAQDLEAHELVDVLGRQRGLVELDPELLHPNGRNVDHGDVSLSSRAGCPCAGPAQGPKERHCNGPSKGS